MLQASLKSQAAMTLRGYSSPPPPGIYVSIPAKGQSGT
jgi:hypothetical protein